MQNGAQLRRISVYARKCRERKKRGGSGTKGPCAQRWDIHPGALSVLVGPLDGVLRAKGGRVNMGREQDHLQKLTTGVSFSRDRLAYSSIFRRRILHLPTSLAAPSFSNISSAPKASAFASSSRPCRYQIQACISTARPRQYVSSIACDLA